MTLVEAYRTLGVDPATAQRETVTKRYRDLVKRLHPDVRPAAEHDRATTELQRVNEAFAAVRDSGFPAFTPAAPASSGPGPGAYASPPPPPYHGGGNGYAQPPPGNGYYTPPPPGNGYYAPPPPGNGYAPPPRGNGFYDPPQPGSAYHSKPPPGYRPYGGGGAATASAPNFGARAAQNPTADFALAQRYLRFDNVMEKATGWYTIVAMFAFLEAFTHHTGLLGIMPVGLSLVSWGISRRARRASWSLVQALWSGQNPALNPQLNAQLRQTSGTATAAFVSAFALAIMMIFLR